MQTIKIFLEKFMVFFSDAIQNAKKLENKKSHF
jgi:hypothetical protein